MHQLRRLFSSHASDDDSANTARQPDTILPRYRDDERRVFASVECPACGIRLDPLPVEHRRCRACGAMVLVYVMDPKIHVFATIAAGKPLEIVESDARRERAQQLGSGPMNRGAFERQRLERARRLGLTTVGVRMEPGCGHGSCWACENLREKRYPITEAPELPNQTCWWSACACEYVFFPGATTPPAPVVEPGEPTG